MSVRVIIGIISFSIAMIGCLMGNIYVGRMIREINKTRQKGNLILPYGFTPGKTLNIFSEYRRLHIGNLHHRALQSGVLMMIALITVAFCLGIL
jgi:hypothetical protein